MKNKREIPKPEDKCMKLVIESITKLQQKRI